MDVTDDVGGQSLVGVQSGTRLIIHQTKLVSLVHLVTSLLCLVLFTPQLGRQLSARLADFSNLATHDYLWGTPLVKVIRPNGQKQALKIPLASLPWMLVILLGVLLTVAAFLYHLQHITPMLLAIGAIMLGAVAYPLGNRKIMAVVEPSMTATEKVLAMLICSYPVWLLIAGLSYHQVGLPHMGQVINTFVVALSSGVIATVLFFKATQLAAHNMRELAAVEATQSMEVVFSVLLSLMFLGHALPTPSQLLGLTLMVGGIIMLAIRE